MKNFNRFLAAFCIALISFPVYAGRNGSGTYTAPSNSWNPVVAGTTIDSSDFNDLLDDIEAAITASVAKDGQTTTTARIPFASGVSTAAGSTSSAAYAATGDLNTGLYFPAADKIGIVAGGTEQLRIESALVAPVANNTVDLGSSSNKYKDAYIAGSLSVATLSGTIAGTPTFSGNLSFSGNPTITGTATLTGIVAVNGTSSSSAGVFFAEDTDNGTHKLTTKAAASMAADYTIIYPDAQGAASSLIVNDGSGNLSWGLTPATTSEIVSGTSNKYVTADNIVPLFYGVSLYATSPTASATPIAFDNEEYDDGGWHSDVTNNSRITPNVAGRYHFVFNLLGTLVGNAAYDIMIRKNGTTPIARFNNAGTTMSPNNFSLSAIDTANGSTDYYECIFTSAAFTMNAGATGTKFQAYRIK